MSSLFGTLVGRDQVGQQVVSVLQTPPTGSAYPRLLYYVAEVERQEGLIPRTLPGPGTFRTGLDFEQFVGDQLPALIVVAQPTGDAERYNAGSYGQWYEIQVGALCFDADGNEITAQQTADRYGAAIMGLLAQNGGLGNPTAFTVDKTIITSGPRTEFVPNAQRSLCLSVVIAHAFVEQIVSEQGPLTFGSDPYTAPTGYPNVAVIDIALQSETPAGSFSPATGVTVTNQSVVVTE